MRVGGLLTLFLLIGSLGLGCRPEQAESDIGQFARFDILFDNATSVELPEEGMILYRLPLVGYFHEGDDSEYAIIDTIEARSWVVPCDTNTAAFFAGDSRCCNLVTIALTPPLRFDTVWQSCDDENVGILCPLMDFAYNRRHDILAYAETLPSDVGPVVARTTIVHILENGSFDTLGVLDSCTHPVIVLDGTQILLESLRTTDVTSQGWTLDILVYDLATKRASYPAPSGQIAYYPYRQSRESPLYYMQNDLDEYHPNLWMVEPEGEPVQVSHFTQPPYPHFYKVTEDSIIYFFPKSPADSMSSSNTPGSTERRDT